MAETRRTTVLSGARLAVMAVALASAVCHRTATPQTRADGETGQTTHATPVAGSTFTDEIGRPVKPRTTPAGRVVSLAPNLTELLFAVGAGPTVVGIDNYSDEPSSEIAAIPKVGSNYEPSLEKIVALAPDVVFTSMSANRRETVEALERLGVPVFVTDTRALVEMDRTFRSLGAITGRARQAEEQISRLHGGLEEIARRVAGRPRPRVLVAVWDDPLHVAGTRTFIDDLIAVAGGTNVTADAQGFAKYPLERVLRRSPEVIVLPTHSTEERGAGAVAYWSRWPELPAVRRKQVFAVNETIISRPGARLVQGAALLARLIHPESGAP